MNKVKKIFDKVTSVLAAIVGTVTVVIPLIKELVVAVVRVIDALTAIAHVIPYLDKVVKLPDTENWVAGINKITDKVLKVTEKIKNWLLKLGVE